MPNVQFPSNVHFRQSNNHDIELNSTSSLNQLMPEAAPNSRISHFSPVINGVVGVGGLTIGASCLAISQISENPISKGVNSALAAALFTLGGMHLGLAMR